MKCYTTFEICYIIHTNSSMKYDLKFYQSNLMVKRIQPYPNKTLNASMLKSIVL